MPDITTILDAHRIMWIRRFFSSPNTQWKVFFEWQFEKVDGISIFQNAHIAINEIENRKLHSFYESLIVAWSQFFAVEPMDKYKKVLA